MAIIDKFINNNNQSDKKSLMNDRISPNQQCSSIEANHSFNASAYVFSTSIDDFTSGTQSVDSIDTATMTTKNNVSPPAVQRSSTATASATTNARKRRRNLINEKENEITYWDNVMAAKRKRSSKSDRAIYDWENIRSTFNEMARRVLQMPIKCTNENSEKVEKQALGAVSAAHAPTKVPPSNKINAIRYKHLVRMVSKKESCKSCQRHTHCMVLSHHTKTSLMLHRFWRHSHEHRGNHNCTKCGQMFEKKYKQILHERLNHP